MLIPQAIATSIKNTHSAAMTLTVTNNATHHPLLSMLPPFAVHPTPAILSYGVVRAGPSGARLGLAWPEA
jgi:hypothetical protein